MGFEAIVGNDAAPKYNLTGRADARFGRVLNGWNYDQVAYTPSQRLQVAILVRALLDARGSGIRFGACLRSDAAQNKAQKDAIFWLLDDECQEFGTFNFCACAIDLSESDIKRLREFGQRCLDSYDVGERVQTSTGRWNPRKVLNV